MSLRTYFNVIDKISSKKILVIGDIMLDRFIWGNVDRISPEAPVPVVEVVKETELLGGCGNVANNILSLKGKVFILSVVGNDENGRRLKQLVDKAGCDTSGIFIDEHRPTTVKTRIIAHNQQVVRIDKESRGQLSPSMIEKMNKFIVGIKNEIDGILISDYGKGVITRSILQTCRKISNQVDIPLTVDPKIEHFMEYKKVTVLTPNLNEATLGMKLHKKPITDEEIYILGRKILKKLSPEALVITLGEKGMALFMKDKKIHHIPTRAKEVYDVTGAGDTVIAVLTLCISSGADMVTSCEISNFAAGVVVGKVGTATVSSEELKEIIKDYYISIKKKQI